VYDVVGIFRAALNRVISDDSSNSSIVLGLHSGKNLQRAVLFKTDCNLAQELGSHLLCLSIYLLCFSSCVSFSSFYILILL